MGDFIVFEGINGSGKTTVIQRVAEILREQGTPVVTMCNPSSGPIGMELRRFVADQRERGFPMFFSRSPPTLTFATKLAALFVGDRVMQQAEIHTALNEGKTVLCDRYSLSTLLYQCAMIGDVALRSDLAEMICSMHTGLIQPDDTIIFDCPVDVARQRLKGRGERVDDTMMASIEPAVRAMYADIHTLNYDGNMNHRLPMGATHQLDASKPLDAVVRVAVELASSIPF